MKCRLFLFLFIILCIDNLCCQIKDFEGNIYDTVQIGNQTWLTSNIRSKFYSDGNPVKSTDYKCANGNCLNIDTTPNEWHQLMLSLNADTTWLWKGAYNYVSDKVISQQYGGSNSSGLSIVPSGVNALGSYYNFGRGEFYKLIDSLIVKGITVFFDGSTNGTIRIDTFLTQAIAKSSDQYLPCRCIKKSNLTLVTGINNKLKFNIYPNPSIDGNITVDLSEELINRKFELQIFSDLGILVYRTTDISSAKINLVLPRGLYVAKIVNPENSIPYIHSKKVVLLNY